LQKVENMEVKIRPAVSSDSAACARLIAETLQASAQRHGFPSELSEAAASRLIARMLDHPEVYGLVAEEDGRIAGTVFLDERSIVRGVGWLAVAPTHQGRGIGRTMMNEVIERSLTAPGMRAVVDESSAGQIGLLGSLRFEVKESLVLLRGRAKDPASEGVEVRTMTDEDIAACDELSEHAHGFARTSELRDAIENGTALIAAHDGRVSAYATNLNSWHAGHAVAASEEDLKALIAGVAAGGRDLSFLIPVRQASLFRWCLGQGLRVERPMLLMSLGEYQDPAPAWLPSGMF
jgi:L-amino acid N-acyltransferase YncA